MYAYAHIIILLTKNYVYHSICSRKGSYVLQTSPFHFENGRKFEIGTKCVQVAE